MAAIVPSAPPPALRLQNIQGYVIKLEIISLIILLSLFSSTVVIAST
jgi:hypothetical protein